MGKARVIPERVRSQRAVTFFSAREKEDLLFAASKRIAEFQVGATCRGSPRFMRGAGRLRSLAGYRVQPSSMP